MSMQDKTVIITGGSRGMGQRLALKLGAEKANVVVNYRRDDEAAKDTVARDRGCGRRGPRRPGRCLRDRIGRVAGRPVGRAFRQPRRRRRERSGERVQAALTDPWAPHREDHESHGPGLPRPGPALHAAHERRRSRHGCVWMGQLPRPARARPARCRQGRDGDSRQVPRDRAGQGQDHHGRASARARSTRTPSATTPATHGRTTRSSGSPRRRRAPTRRPTRSRTSWPTWSHRRAPRSTARRSSSTADCRSRRCRSASGRTERGERVLGGRPDRRPAHATGRAAGPPATSRSEEAGGGRRLTIGALAEDSNRLANAFVGLGLATRRPCRVRRPEPSRVRRTGVRTPEGGTRQGPAEPSLRTPRAPAMHRARGRAPHRGGHRLRGGDRRGVRRRRTTPHCHRRAGQVAVVRRPGGRRFGGADQVAASDPMTSTTSGSAPARPESRKASRSPTAEHGRPCSATRG